MRSSRGVSLDSLITLLGEFVVLAAILACIAVVIVLAIRLRKGRPRDEDVS